ncbi:MAG TPA: lactate racemase domain-containing protein [Anaerovoracaceae bacterium]|nr:lactate racemase domain-containing protein [Anaerovoracaceae bacterium]
MTIKKYYAAYGKGADSGICLPFPETWRVETVSNSFPAMSDDDIIRSIQNTIGSPTLYELARKASQVAIILEDHTRFTPLKTAVDFTLSELERAGIRSGNILMIGASATHRPTTREDIAKKISAKALNKVRVIEHKVLCRESLAYIGTTSRGTPVYLNAEACACDLMIGIGGIAPHGSVHFGGGAKLLLPGIAGFDTIRHNHTQIDQDLDFTGDAIRPMRLDMEEAVSMTNYRFNISGLIGHDGALADMVSGDPILAHREGMKKGKRLYYVPIGKKADLVVACSNPLDVDAFQSIKGLLPSVAFVKPGGTILWVSACPEGMGTHILTQMDDEYCKAMKRGMKNVCKEVNVIFYSHNLDINEIKDYMPPEIMFTDKLEEALNKTLSLTASDATVKILQASPFTVGI